MKEGKDRKEVVHMPLKTTTVLQLLDQDVINALSFIILYADKTNSSIILSCIIHLHPSVRPNTTTCRGKMNISDVFQQHIFKINLTFNECLFLKISSHTYHPGPC